MCNGGRPRRVPSSLARRMPARTRSTIKRPFQLRDGADDDDDRAAQRAGGVELFAKADELDIQAIEFIEHFEEVADAAGQPIAGPYQHNIELPAAGIGHHLVQTWPAGTCSGDAIGVALGDFVAALLGHLFEIV